MSEHEPETGLDTGPLEGSGGEVTERKDGEENKGVEEPEIKDGEENKGVEEPEIKDGGGENDSEEKNVIHEAKVVEERKDGNVKDDVEEAKQINGNNCMEVEKDKLHADPKEVQIDEEEMVVEEVKNKDQNGGAEGTENMCQVGVEDVKDGEEKDNMEEKESKVEKMDEEGHNAEVVEGEGNDKIGTDDMEMTKATVVNDESKVDLETGGEKDDRGMEVENKGDDKDDEGENTKANYTAKKVRGKRSKTGAKREPKEKKEEGKEKKREGNDKEKKNGEKKAKGPSHVLTPPTIERPIRERKTVERLVEVIDKEPNKRVIIGKGRGTPLKNIPNVAYKLAKRKPNDLKLLHQTLFGRIGKAVDFKDHILQFSGFEWPEDDEKQRAKIKEKLDKCVKDSLLDLCDLLDIPVLKSHTKKEDLLVMLLDFLATPHATTEVLLVESDQQTPNTRKRKRFPGESASKSNTNKKQRKSEGRSTNKLKVAEDSEDEENEEDDKYNGLTDEDDELKESESEKETDDVVSEEDDSEDYGQGKRNKRVPSKSKSSGNRKMNVRSRSKKTSLAISGKSPERTSSAAIEASLIGKNPTRARTTTHSSKSSRASAVGEKVFVRKKKQVDSPKEKSDVKLMSTEEDEPMLDEAVQSGPTTAQLRKTISEILTKVDYSKATFSDILKRLATKYKTDLTPRSSSIKEIIQEELTKLADAVEVEDQGNKQGAEGENNPKVKTKNLKT